MAPTTPDFPVIRRFVQQLPGLKSISDVLWEAADLVGQLGFEDCVIYQLHPERKVLQQMAACGDKAPKRGEILNRIEIPLGHGITGQVAMKRENMIIRDVAKTPHYIVDLELLQSEVTVCIMTHGQVFGVLDCESPEPNAFDQTHLELLEFVVDLITPKLEMLQLETDLQPSKSSLIKEKNQIRKQLDELKLEGDNFTYSREMKKISQLTGGIAHDFNNQLGVIRNGLELLCLNHPSVSNEMSDLQGAIDRAAELIQRLLAYSSQLKLSPNSVNLAQLIRKIRAVLAPTLQPGIHIQTKIDDSLKNVRLDPYQMERVLFNLTLNACEAMPTGGTLTVSCYNTLVEPEFLPCGMSLKKGAYVVVEVSDTGAGMDDDTRGRIFEPYFTTKPTTSGTGLGLSMVYGFVKQSGGDVLVTSIKGKGSSFKLFFPSHDFPVDEIASITKKNAQAKGANETVLVLDDDVNMAQSIAKLLQIKGYKPLVATTADQAIALSQEHPDIQLVISDVILDVDHYGPNVVKTIRKFIPGISCIYISGFVNPDNKKPDDELNNNVFLVKPFSLSKLGDAVGDLLSDRTSAKENRSEVFPVL